MTKLEEFSLEIPGFTPETMPFDRLLLYLENVAILLGEPSDLHLVDIKKGSTRPVFALRKDVAARARERVSEVRRGGGSTRRRNAFERIDKMVREDGGPAYLRVDDEAPLLTFQGEPEPQGVIRNVRQSTTIDGKLIRVGGVRENSTLLVEDWSGETIVGCTATRSLAKQLAPLLYEPIRLNGMGSWARASDGKWSLQQMQVQTYEALSDAGHAEVIRELQSVRATWPDDAMEQLAALRTGTS